MCMQRGQVYLDAWAYAGSLKPLANDSHVGDAITKLIDNWTNSEFVQFVDELAELVNRCVMTNAFISRLSAFCHGSLEVVSVLRSCSRLTYRGQP